MSTDQIFLERQSRTKETHANEVAKISAQLEAEDIAREESINSKVLNHYEEFTLDWKSLLEGELEETKWLVEPLIEHGRSIALVSEAKAGKSLLALEIAAGLASGKSVLGNPTKKVKVLYVDLENTKADLRTRLKNLGYIAEELEGLKYLSFPNLPMLDGYEGGQHLLRLAIAHEVELVIIDTLSRVVNGDENESSTYHSLYSHTLVHLKAKEIAVMRLDHLGKDSTKGARGSSAKMSDVDSVWNLRADGEQITLTRTHTRSNNGVGVLNLKREEDPFRHEVISDLLEERFSEISLKLDKAGVNREAGRPAVSEELKRLGIRMNTQEKGRLVSYRKSLAVALTLPTLSADFTAEEVLSHLQTVPDSASENWNENE